jgi:hypothetical protein
MDSIYLRSITNHLRGCYNSHDKSQSCVYCESSCAEGYHFKQLYFCNAYHANEYHRKHDIGAVTSSINNLLLLREIELCPDVVRYIASLLYVIRKRSIPNFDCTYCDTSGFNGFHFVGDIAFCSKNCRRNYYKNNGCSNSYIRKLKITTKPLRELNTKYKY